MTTRIHTVVVDGGGTSTRVRLHDTTGRAVAEAAAGPSSLTLGVPQAWDSVDSAVRKACAACGLCEPEVLGLRMVAGFAGGRSPTNRAAFVAQDRLRCSEIRVVTDGYASLVGALGGEPGLVLAVGTGVTAYSLAVDGAVRQSSGWGFPAGDEGGGAWIGHRALQAFLRSLDGRLHESSVVFERIASTIGRDFDEIQCWLARARSTQFALLARAVTDSAREGDALAERILDAATAELEETVAAVDTGGALPVAVLGGLSAIFSPRFSGPIRARIVPAKGSALDGLHLIASGVQEREALT